MAATTTVNVIANPTLMVVANTTVCAGTSATITASGASTYTWSPAVNINTSSGSVVVASPASTESYTVTGTLTVSYTHLDVYKRQRKSRAAC